MNNKIKSLYKTVCFAIAGLACLVSLSGFSEGAIEANTTKEVVGANSINFDPAATTQMIAWLETPEKGVRPRRKGERDALEEMFREAGKLLKGGRVDLYAKINSPVGEISIKHYLLATAFKQCKLIFNGYASDDLAQKMYSYDPEDYAPEGRSAKKYTKERADYRPETLKALVQMRIEKHFFRKCKEEEGDFFECIDVQKLLICRDPEGALIGCLAKVLTRNVSFEFLHDTKKLVVRSVEVKDPVYATIDGQRVMIVDEKTFKEAQSVLDEQLKLKDGWTVTEIK